MRILITGGSGLLGQYLNIELNKKNQILTLYNNNIGNAQKFLSEKIELTEFANLDRVIFRFKPEVIIHTAAITDVNIAETMDWQKLFLINVEVTRNIAEICREVGTKLVFTSTDLVYEGIENCKKDEDAKLKPLSLYAKSKLQAEEQIIKVDCEYMILRLSLMFGFGLNHSVNHFSQTINKLKNGEDVFLFSDQYRSQISLREASRIISILVKSKNWNEVINIGGKERVSRYELFERYANYAKLDKKLLHPVLLKDSAINHKVFDVSFNTEKLDSLLSEFTIEYHPSSIEKMFEEL